MRDDSMHAYKFGTPLLPNHAGESVLLNNNNIARELHKGEKKRAYTIHRNGSSNSNNNDNTQILWISHNNQHFEASIFH